MTDPLPRLQLVVEEIQEALGRAQAIIDFVLEHQAIPETRVAIFNNVIVSLVSNVEEGIRSLFMEYMTIIEENVSYNHLRDDLVNSNVRSAADLLKRSVGLSGLNQRDLLNATEIAKRLLDCLTGLGKFRLFKDEIANNRANMRSQEISALAKRVGFRDFWKAVRQRPEARASFPDSTDDQIEQQILDRWNRLFDERDVIVHRISRATGWGDTMISPYIIFLGMVMECICHCLADDAKAVLEAAGRRAQAEP